MNGGDWPERYCCDIDRKKKDCRQDNKAHKKVKHIDHKRFCAKPNATRKAFSLFNFNFIGK